VVAARSRSARREAFLARSILVSANDRPKLIYVAQRHPRYDHEAFIQRWRQHASLGMSQARWRNVVRYFHCDRVDGLPPSVPTFECDGVAIVVYRSEQAREAHIADELARRTMKADELDTFAQPVANTSVLVREEAERDGPLDGFRLFVFWSGSDAAERAHCWDRLRGGAGVALTRNRPAGPAGNWPWTGVDELISADVERLGALASEFARERQATVGEARFVLTHTVVLHDVTDPRDATRQPSAS
jgi:hypothetical protein